jgi:hypothetical protein
LRLAVNSPARLEHALTAGGIPFSRRLDATIVAPANAMGATLVFQQNLTGAAPGAVTGP